jgi:DNA (cytosine-5)-methyltransferase 1
MTAYYNEIDPFAAEWLRNLIQAGHIAPGDVDTRSITDVRPDDLNGYSQCHFFAGIGVWSHSLRLAGWRDDRPVWTGSCPCQPFSAAGKGEGQSDPRHLWPVWFKLIEQCRPPVVFGEQVEAAIRHGWLDLVQDDLEGIGYATGAASLPAGGIGAPHTRQRLWFVAHSSSAASQRDARSVSQAQAGERGENWYKHGDMPVGHSHGGANGGMADSIKPDHRCQAESADHRPSEAIRPADRVSGCGSSSGELADTDIGRRAGDSGQITGILEGQDIIIGNGSLADQYTSPTDHFWRDADWLFCRDGKWRPVESQPQPLADGSAESLGFLRSDIIATLTEEINATAMEAKILGTEAVRMLWEDLGAQAQRCWPTRGVPRLHEAPFLLAFVRQLASQGWHLAQGIPLSRQKDARSVMRGMWLLEATGSASHQRGLDGQSSGERADIVRVLSCILARHAQAAWGEAYKTYAAVGFPLSTGEPARVGRLRAYGNAIVPQVAAEVVSAYLDCRP